MVWFSVEPNQFQNLAFGFTSYCTYLKLGSQLNSQPNNRVPRTGPVQGVLVDGPRIGLPPGAPWCLRR